MLLKTLECLTTTTQMTTSLPFATEFENQNILLQQMFMHTCSELHVHVQAKTSRTCTYVLGDAIGVY